MPWVWLVVGMTWRMTSDMAAAWRAVRMTLELLGRITTFSAPVAPGRLQQFLGARVHGALAGNYGVTAEVVEEVNEPFSPGYGDDGKGRDVLFLGVEGKKPLVLLADVVHLNANGAAEGGSVGYDLVGFEGVDVNLGEGGVTDDYEGAAFFGEVASKGGHVYVYAFNHELSAENRIPRTGWLQGTPG